MALFSGNDTHYGTHGEPSPEQKGGATKWIIQPTAKTLKGAVTEKMWKEHCDGTKPLGVVPIKQDNTALWGSIDYDVYGEDLTELIARIEAAKFPLVPCRSKSGGLHLFFFALEPIPAVLMFDLLRMMAAALGIAESEIFPKQTELLTERGDFGTWMVMPYFGGDFDGKLKMQVGLRANGGEIGLSEFVRSAEKMRQTEAQTRVILANIGTPAPVPAKKGKGTRKAGDKGPMPADDLTVPYGDGPVCLQMMVAYGGVKTGGRNNALFHMGVYYKKKFPDTWEEELARANAIHLVPAGSESGLDSVIKSLKKKDYEYKCKDAPMVNHCDSIACRAKRYGVTGSSVMAPLITSIKKLNSEPPVWFVTVEKAQLECTTEDLQRWDRFQKKLIEKLHNPFGVMPQPLWLATIGAALKNMKPDDTIEVSQDAKEGGEFQELLGTFLTNRQAAVREEDLLSDRPWEDEEVGRYYFNLGKLQKFLKKEGMDNMKRPQIVAQIDKLKGGHEKKTVKGKELDLHWVDTSKVRRKPKVSTPELKEKPI